MTESPRDDFGALGDDSPGEPPIDWSAAGRLFRAFLRKELGRCEEAELADCVQEALIRLLRATRREPARDAEALMRTIARRTAIDLIRRRRRWKLIWSPGLPDTADIATPADSFLDHSVDPLDRVRFVILEIFQERNGSCYHLAQAYFQERKWEEVAAEAEESSVAIRKRWSRCVAYLRKMAGKDPSLVRLLGWE